MKCQHCKKKFYAEIAHGLHGWDRKSRGRCATDEEMVEAGWYNHSGQWLTSKPAWVSELEAQSKT